MSMITTTPAAALPQNGRQACYSTTQELFARVRGAEAAFTLAAEGSSEREAASDEMEAAEEALLAAVATDPADMAWQIEYIVADESGYAIEGNARAALARIAARLKTIAEKTNAPAGAPAERRLPPAEYYAAWQRFAAARHAEPLTSMDLVELLDGNITSLEATLRAMRTMRRRLLRARAKAH